MKIIVTALIFSVSGFLILALLCFIVYLTNGDGVTLEKSFVAGKMAIIFMAAVLWSGVQVLAILHLAGINAFETLLEKFTK